MRASEDSSFTGAQKAAVLMLALGEEQSARLFGMMHEDEIKEVSAAMSQLGSVRAELWSACASSSAKAWAAWATWSAAMKAPSGCCNGHPAARPGGADHG